MVGVLAAPAPAVGRRSKQFLRLGIYFAGMLLTSIPIGAAIGLVGALALQLGAVEAALIAGAMAGAYSLHDAGLLRLPYPQRRCQVPNRWRRSGHPLLTAFGYGLGLGPGFLVYIRSGAYFVVVIGIALAGSPLLGAIAFALIAFGRFAFTAAASVYRSRSDHPVLIQMASLDQRVRFATAGVLAANATFLATVGLAAL